MSHGLRSLWVVRHHITRKRDSVIDIGHLTRKYPVALDVLPSVWHRRSVVVSHARRLEWRPVACAALDLGRTIHMTVDIPITHHSGLHMAVNTVHPKLVVYIWRVRICHTVVVVGIELLVSRTGYARSGRKSGWHLRAAGKRKSNASAAMMAVQTLFCWNTFGDGVHPRVPRLRVINRRVGTLREAVVVVQHVACSTPICSVQAILTLRPTIPLAARP